MAGNRAVIQPADGGGVVVLLPVRQLQRRNDRVPDGNHAADVRTAGFSLVHSGATAIFGGFTPAISTYLIHATGNRAIPGLWLSFAAACGLIATVLLSSSRVARLSVDGPNALRNPCAIEA